MKHEHKHYIRQRLDQYVREQAGSQKKASNMLKGISNATISNMLAEKWDSISDEMWRAVDAQIATDNGNGWNVVETRSYKLFQQFMKDTQQHGLVMGVIGDAGCGKTLGISEYSLRSKNCYVLRCKDYWDKRFFLSELIRAMGKQAAYSNISEMMEEIVMELKRKDSPIIILDEADKLNDGVLYFFISLYNDLEDDCGILLVATDHLEKRVKRGVRLNKKGYKEIYSRLGRKFISLDPASRTEVESICRMNGLEDSAEIKEIVAEAEGDLRRVKRKVHALKAA
ncbi:MAG: AAA family ATPase [Bacteroidetes bacterium]|nr:AAA family ATPase [Bacteroidota bacterium]